MILMTGGVRFTYMSTILVSPLFSFRVSFVGYHFHLRSDQMSFVSHIFHLRSDQKSIVSNLLDYLIGCIYIIPLLGMSDSSSSQPDRVRWRVELYSIILVIRPLLGMSKLSSGV